MKQETLEEAYDRIFDGKLDRVLKAGFIAGAKWKQERLCNSEVIQRIRASKSDAEARRIIRTI